MNTKICALDIIFMLNVMIDLNYELCYISFTKNMN